MRAAIYARYSSDLQSAASIADQVRVCRKLCHDNGWKIAEVYTDEALSGASHLRPGFQALQQAAQNGEFDIIVAEALDRLSRDQEHIAALHKRMAYLGVSLFTKAEGTINELHIGLGGTMSALFLRQLAEKTHRGLEGRVRSQKSAGGISFGYRVVQTGSDLRGERTIDATEAKIIRRIFDDYAGGKSARAIAAELNKEGIPSPRASNCARSGQWSFSTISGNHKRGTGILNNELYIGKLVWNRQRYVKDPETGKRQARLNPPEAIIVEEVPHLRIIPQDIWDRVKERQLPIRDVILDAREANGKAPNCELGRRQRYLLSGLLFCAHCGSSDIMISADRYGCSAARN